MKKIFKTLVLLLGIYISLSFKNVYAIDACTTSELTRLRELADNVEFKKEETIEVDEEKQLVDVNYLFKFINFDSNLKIDFKGTYMDKSIEIKSGEEMESVFFENDSVKFNIYSYTDNLCTDRLLRTVTIKLPIYNDYYYFNKNKCLENPDFKYCKEYMDVSNIEFSEIDKLYDEYVKKEKYSLDNEDNKITLYIIISGVILTVIAITIVVFVIKNNKKEEI